MGTLTLLLTADDPAMRQIVQHGDRDGADDSRGLVVGAAELFRGGLAAANGVWDRIQVVAGSVAALRALLPQLTSMDCRTRVVEIVVAGHPRPGLLGPPVRPVGHRAVISVNVSRADRPDRHVRLALRLSGSTPLGDVLAAVLDGGVRPFGRPLGGLRVGIAADVPEAMRWACGDPAAVRLAPGESGLAGIAGQPNPVDVVLTARVEDDAAGGAAATPPNAGGVAVVDIGGPAGRPSWPQLATASRRLLESFATGDRDYAPLPPVDTEVLTPIGFVTVPGPDDAWVRRRRPGGSGTPATLAVAGRDGRSSSIFDEWSGLSESVVDELRSYRAVHDVASAHAGPVEQAAFLAQAACAALPVVVAELSAPTRRLLGEPLADALTSVTVDDLDDRIRREQHCMDIRRLAFEQHGARRRWSAIAGQLGRPGQPPPTVSVVLATRRPDLLPRIAEQVAAQDWPRLELVVGAHGFGRDHPNLRDLEKTFPSPLTVAEIPAERALGDLLNDLCSLASGDFVAKMDDDDWYGAHHLTDLVHAAEYSRADVVGGGAEFLYLEALDLTVRRHRSSGHRFTSRVPGASLLLSRDTLRALGGWRPIHRAVDTALARAVADSGGSIYRTHGLGMVVYRAAAGHTWDPGVEYFLRGDVDQWPGFMAPPGIVAAAPPAPPLPPSWFDRRSSWA